AVGRADLEGPEIHFMHDGHRGAALLFAGNGGRGSSSMAALATQCRADEGAEQRMRTMWPRRELRMKLGRQEPGMPLQLDDLHQAAVRREPAEHESLGRQLFPVGVVEFIAV